MPVIRSDNRRYRVDEVLEILPREKAEEFLSLSAPTKNTSFPEMADWFRQEGYEVEVPALRRWYESRYPTGEEARALNALMAAWHGVDSYGILQGATGAGMQASGVIGLQLQRLVESIDIISNDPELEPADKDKRVDGKLLILAKLGMMYNGLLRETREAATKRIELDREKREKDISLGVLHKVLAKMQDRAKDTPEERAILAFIQGIKYEVESEIFGGA